MPRHISPERVLARIEARRDREIAKLAEHVRRTVVIPMCKKYGLAYIAGMGMWMFSDAKDNFSGIDGADEAGRAGYGLRRAFKMLRTPVDSHTQLGDWISNYDPPNLYEKKS